MPLCIRLGALVDNSAYVLLPNGAKQSRKCWYVPTHISEANKVELCRLWRPLPNVKSETLSMADDVVSQTSASSI